MRISVWSSDVCSSDLGEIVRRRRACGQAVGMSERGGDVFAFGEFAGDEPDAQRRHSRRESEARQLDIGPREIDRLLASGAFVVRYGMLIPIGRASCRERVCPTV